MYRRGRASGIIALGEGARKIEVKRTCLALRLGKCFTSECLPNFVVVVVVFFFGGMAQKLNKITALKGDVCKQAISMLNVPGIFFIAFSSRRSYGKIEDC